MTHEEYKKLYENFNLFSKEQIQKWMQRHEDARKEVLRSIDTTTTVIGILAGFGFTAIHGVKTLPLFVIGEIILIFSLIYIVNMRRKNSQIAYEYIEKVTNFLLDQQSRGTDILKRYSNYTKKDYKDLFTEYEKLMKSYDVVADITREYKDKLEKSDIAYDSLILALLGVIFVLASFFVWKQDLVS